jgi:hypothetical protein
LKTIPAKKPDDNKMPSKITIQRDENFQTKNPEDILDEKTI